MKWKRIIAYLIDFAILSIFILLISSFVKTSNIDHLQIEMNALNEQFLTKKVDFITYLNYYSIILHDMDMQRIVIHLIGILYMSLYYIVLPYKNKGRTLGKMIMHIEVYQKGKLHISTFIKRSMLINGFAYVLLSTLFVLILPSFSYLLTISILAIFQIILVFTSGFMILYREDGKAVHDLLTASHVREYDEVKK